MASTTQSGKTPLDLGMYSYEELRNEIHVWSIERTCEKAVYQKALTLLTRTELHRAARFLDEAAKQEFVLSRALLRSLLSHYIFEEAGCINVLYGRFGKPFVQTPWPLQFNVSHSGTRSAYAFTSHSRVGIDIEKIVEVHDCEDLAARFFSAEERRDLSRIDSELRMRGFFDLWVRKEAYLKGISKGLSLAPHTVRVTVIPNEPAAILKQPHGETGAWVLRPLRLAEDYAAALAFERPELRVTAIPPCDVAQILTGDKFFQPGF